MIRKLILITLAVCMIATIGCAQGTTKTEPRPTSAVAKRRYDVCKAKYDSMVTTAATAQSTCADYVGLISKKYTLNTLLSARQVTANFLKVGEMKIGGADDLTVSQCIKDNARFEASMSAISSAFSADSGSIDDNMSWLKDELGRCDYHIPQSWTVIGFKEFQTLNKYMTKVIVATGKLSSRMDNFNTISGAEEDFYKARFDTADAILAKYE